MTAPTTEKPDTSLHGSNLILNVENFGPIAEARNIEFKPMTVFVGPSNTGKTYLAMLMHAFASAIAAANRATQSYSPLRDLGPERLAPQQQSAIINDFKNFGWMFRHNTSPQMASWDKVPLTAFSETSRDAIHDQLNDHRDRYANAITETIADFFAVEGLGALARETAFGSNASLPFVSVKSHSQRVDIRTSGADMDATPVHLNIPPAYVDYRAMSQLEDYPEENSKFITEIELLIGGNYADEFIDVPDSWYLPAGRTGFMDARRLMLTISPHRTLGKNTPSPDHTPINRATRECIRLLNSAQPISDKRFSDRLTLKPSIAYELQKPKSNIATLLEQSLIDGELIIDSSNGATEILYARNGFAIPVTKASSMVNEIAPILIYLRNYVFPSDLIIIDEPEAHLHPAAQQQMAAALAFMVRSGLRVLITTHSHYMVEQLGNFVAASKLDTDLRKRVLKLDGVLGKEDIYLKESETAVYDFATDKSKNGSVVSPVNFDTRRHGFFPQDHNWSIADQMNRTQRVIQASVAKRKNAST